MKVRERPEIELYMYSLNQEFPVEKGHATFLKRRSETMEDVTGKLVAIEEVASQTYRTVREVNDWSVQWIHNKWIENYTKTAGMIAERINPIEHLLMREEEFGGILFDPVNDRVYKVNTPGYKLMQEIIESYKKGKLKKFRSRHFAREDIEHFIYFLKGAGLWPE